MIVPFMWDSVLMEYVESLMGELGLDTLFETGTYHGDTALYFDSKGYKVITVEIDYRQYKSTLSRFIGTSIEAINSPSEEMIGSYIKEYDISKTLFYLDAHGHGYEKSGRYGPLMDELNQLFTLPRFIALVHDVHWKINNCPYKVNPKYHSTELQNDFERIKLPNGIDVTAPNYDGDGCAYLFLSRGYKLVNDSRFFYDKVN